MNELQIFNHPDFGRVRTIDEDRTILFCGKDVASALGYKSPKDAITAHCKGAVKRRLPTTSGEQEMSFIPESDLYRLVFSSKLPTAEKFTDWVTSEVLPSIRKHGAYMTQETLQAAILNPDTMIQLCQQLKAEQEKSSALQKENDAMQPKALFADSVAASGSTVLVGELAKILRQNGVDMGEKRLFSWMRENGYLIKRNGTDYNMPTQRSMDMGLFRIKETVVTHCDGHTTVTKTTKVTGKGQQYFINLFLKK